MHGLDELRPTESRGSYHGMREVTAKQMERTAWSFASWSGLRRRPEVRRRRRPSGRGCAARFRAHKSTGPGQEGGRRINKKKGGTGEARSCLGSPESCLDGGGNGGTAGFNTGSLGAYALGFRGGFGVRGWGII